MPVQSPFFLVLLLFIIGIGGMTAQTILLRELLIVFTGNELSMGAIIGAWVVWGAIGAYLGGRAHTAPEKAPTAFSCLALLFTILFPLSIYLARTFKVLAGIPVDLGSGLYPILYVSFLILLPTGFIHGFLFTLACKVWSQLTGEETASTGKVYYYQMVGTIAGGILVNFLLLPFFHSFRIAVGLIFLTGLACLFFSLSLYRFRKRVSLAVIASFTLFSIVFFFAGGADRLHEHTIERQWQGKNLVFYGNSFYQNIVITKAEDQYTFFSDGLPFMTIPVPDIASTEEFSHIPLLSHPRPQRVLVMGGGAGGTINEILKHPTVSRIDYVEIDPLLVDTLRRFPTALTDRELKDHRVQIHLVDGRTFLKAHGANYDVVLVGFPPPHTLQQNRFFTEEFFKSVKGSLHKDGLVAITMTGSLAYYSAELRALNLCMIMTLESVFPYLFVMPGEANLFMASGSPAVSAISSSLLSGRLKERNVPTLLLTPTHLDYRMLPEQREWFFLNIRAKDVSVNRDFSPKGFFYNIAYQNLLYSPSTGGLFRAMKNLRPYHAFLLAAALFFLVFVLRRRRPGLPLLYAIGTTGFTAMVAELALLFAFQIFYGYIFYEIGLLLTLFMGGMATGSFLTLTPLVRAKPALSVLKAAEAGFVVFSLVLAFIFRLTQISSFPALIPFYPLLLGLLFVVGLLTGVEFPLATQSYASVQIDPHAPGSPSVGRSVGILYSADLAGGWIGGLVAGFLLLPILGLPQSCLLLAGLKGGSLLLLFISRQK